MAHLVSGPILNNLLVVAVREHNVVPLTGSCNLSCIFCSHSHNPPGTEAFSFPPLPLELLRGLLPYLDPEKKIIIGESATRLREGEPLTHPQFLSFIGHLRRHYPNTPIQITTNGTLLDEEAVESLAVLKPLELVLSLNSISEKGRRLLMNDTRPEQAIRAVQLLQSYEIPFHGSLVALPHLSGWDDLQNTIECLDRAGAITVRFLLPGYTKLSDPSLVPPHGTDRKCYRLLDTLRRKLRTPLLAEPPLIEDLDAAIEGVLKGSPAQKAGLLPGDRIIYAAGSEVVSRVDAYQRIAEKENPRVELLRDGGNLKITVQKNSSEASGLAVAYDLDPDQLKQLRASLPPQGETLMLVSKPALKRWQIAAEKFALRGLVLHDVPSVYFGGSIESAGLLTVGDFQSALDRRSDLNRFNKVLLPAIAFNGSGMDLCGISYFDIDTGRIPVQLV